MTWMTENLNRQIPSSLLTLRYMIIVDNYWILIVDMTIVFTYISIIINRIELKANWENALFQESVANLHLTQTKYKRNKVALSFIGVDNLWTRPYKIWWHSQLLMMVILIYEVHTHRSFGTIHGSRTSKSGLRPPDAGIKWLRAAVIYHCRGKGKKRKRGKWYLACGIKARCFKLI